MGQDADGPIWYGLTVPRPRETRDYGAGSKRDIGCAGVSGSDAATIQVKIRVTPLLLARLQAAAAERGVAFNREIVIRLIESFAERESAREIDESVKKLGKRIDEVVFRISAMHRESLSLPPKTWVRKRFTGKDVYAKKIVRKRYNI